LVRILPPKKHCNTGVDPRMVTTPKSLSCLLVTAALEGQSRSTTSLASTGYWSTTIGGWRRGTGTTRTTMPRWHLSSLTWLPSKVSLLFIAVFYLNCTFRLGLLNIVVYATIRISAWTYNSGKRSLERKVHLKWKIARVHPKWTKFGNVHIMRPLNRNGNPIYIDLGSHKRYKLQYYSRWRNPHQNCYFSLL
jgi:hypothetical protein